MDDATFYLIFGLNAYFDDAFYLSVPWIMLILSKQMRDEAFKVLRLKKTGTVAQSLVSHSANVSRMY